MLRTIESFLGSLVSGGQDQHLDDEEIHVATAALLVHCAKADGEFSETEQVKLRAILVERLGLSERDTELIIDVATEQERHAVDIHRFTRVLHENLDRDGRLQIVRLLWEMADADDAVDHDEKNVVSLVAKLMHIEGPLSVALRQEVARRKAGS